MKPRRTKAIKGIWKTADKLNKIKEKSRSKMIV